MGSVLTKRLRFVAVFPQNHTARCSRMSIGEESSPRRCSDSAHRGTRNHGCSDGVGDLAARATPRGPCGHGSRGRYAGGSHSDLLRSPEPTSVPGCIRRVLAALSPLLRHSTAGSALARNLWGWAIPKGSLGMLAPWVTHRDPRFWNAPLEFSPSRWTPEAKAQRHRNAFLAIGGGPKICMGESFA